MQLVTGIDLRHTHSTESVSAGCKFTSRQTSFGKQPWPRELAETYKHTAPVTKLFVQVQPVVLLAAWVVCGALQTHCNCIFNSGNRKSRNAGNEARTATMKEDDDQEWGKNKTASVGNPPLKSRWKAGGSATQHGQGKTEMKSERPETKLY